MFSPDALQYGALGLVFIMIVAATILAKAMLERMFTQADENMKRVFAQADENMKLAREQIEKADAERAGQLEAWITAHKDQLVASVSTAESLAIIRENLREILVAIQHLNGVNSEKGGES